MDRISSWETITPHESFLGDSAEEAFELLAPSVTGPLVARLIPVNSNTSITSSSSSGLKTIELYRDIGNIIIGRSKELVMECRINVARISGKHCELRVNPLTRQITIRDISTNGTYVNGNRLERNVDVELHSGDRISLTKPEISEESVKIESTSTDKNSSDNNPILSENAEYIFQRVLDATTVGNMEEELTCSVCKRLYLRPCSVLPCMHVFCASCISQWLKVGNLTCIECRSKISEIRPTHKIQNCVEQLLQANPTLSRTKEEIEECVASDEIPPNGRKLNKRSREEVSNDENSNDSDNNSYNEDNDESNTSDEIVLASLHYSRDIYGHTQPSGPCKHCTNASLIDGFHCPEEGLHQTCSQCNCLFPQRPLCNRPQQCQLCSIPYCNLYYEEEGGCPAITLNNNNNNNNNNNRNYSTRNSGGLIRLNQYHAALTLPRQTFNGNTVEQNILSNYLASKNITIEMVWENCMSKLQAREWIPDIACVNGELTINSALCEKCMETVFASLLFHYRRSIPSSEFPERVSDRPNCWYGINCRTQFHKMHHANNYNHVCYEEKRKE